LALGALWGWLPCGLVYSTLTWALASGHWLNGALVMISFGLGTLPALLFISLQQERLISWLKQENLRKIASLAIIIYGLYTLKIALGQFF
jgi:sulfite exporter TauE/SafE